ncbi:MAG: c-type cytochrome [Alphaproteobacteria bacterium]|nr:c-type cytochrome [Alphaproteobacteria bacterium]
MNEPQDDTIRRLLYWQIRPDGMIDPANDRGSAWIRLGMIRTEADADKRAKFLLTSVIIAVVITAAYMFYEKMIAEYVPRADPDNAQQVNRGRQVYFALCAECHGMKLEGQENWQAMLPEGGRRGPPHDETGHTWHHPDQVLFDITKQGGQPFSPAGYKNNMPGFGDRLSDQDIWAVIAFIKSRWPDEIREKQDAINRRAGN